MSACKPARASAALVDAHIPQLDVHPHDPPAQRDSLRRLLYAHLVPTSPFLSPPQPGSAPLGQAGIGAAAAAARGGDARGSAMPPDPPVGAVPPPAFNRAWGEAGGGLGVGKGRGSSSWVRLLLLRRGFDASSWGMRAAGVAPAGCPSPPGAHPPPWVGKASPLANETLPSAKPSCPHPPYCPANPPAR